MVPSVRIVRDDAGLVVRSDLTALRVNANWRHAEKYSKTRTPQDCACPGRHAASAPLPGEYDCQIDNFQGIFSMHSVLGAQHVALGALHCRLLYLFRSVAQEYRGLPEGVW